MCGRRVTLHCQQRSLNHKHVPCALMPFMIVHATWCSLSLLALSTCSRISCTPAVLQTFLPNIYGWLCKLLGSATSITCNTLIAAHQAVASHCLIFFADAQPALQHVDSRKVLVLMHAKQQLFALCALAPLTMLAGDAVAEPADSEQPAQLSRCQAALSR